MLDGVKPMDTPIRIVLLRDADKCEINQELMDARNKFTIGNRKMNIIGG